MEERGNQSMIDNKVAPVVIRTFAVVQRPTAPLHCCHTPHAHASLLALLSNIQVSHAGLSARACASTATSLLTAYRAYACIGALYSHLNLLHTHFWCHCLLTGFTVHFSMAGLHFARSCCQKRRQAACATPPTGCTARWLLRHATGREQVQTTPGVHALLAGAMERCALDSVDGARQVGVTNGLNSSLMVVQISATYR